MERQACFLKLFSSITKFYNHKIRIENLFLLKYPLPIYPSFLLKIKNQMQNNISRYTS